MREQTIQWYTPEERSPEEDRDLVYRTSNGRYKIGEFVKDPREPYFLENCYHVDSDSLDKVKEWTYL